MEKPKFNDFPMLSPLTIQRYERYLPTAFDESMSLLEKSNKIIEFLNHVERLLGNFKVDWETFANYIIDYQDNFVTFWEDFVAKVEGGVLIWLEPVNTVSDLYTTYPNAIEGNSAMVRQSENGYGKVYRFTNGVWKVIQEMDVSAINEIDTRLSARLNGIIQDVSIVVTVGTTGDYQTINEALAYLSRKKLKHGTNIKAEIRLLTGFVMREQVYVEGLDLGWIVISSVDSKVMIQRSSLTQTVINIPAYSEGAFPLTSKGVFNAWHNATLPVINTLFEMDETGETTDGHHAFFVGRNSAVVIMPDKGCINTSGVGIYCVEGGRVIAPKANISYAKNNALNAFRGAYVNFREGNASNSGGYGAYLDNVSLVDASASNFSDAYESAVWVSGSSILNVNRGNLSGSKTRNGIQADASSIVDAHLAIINNSAQRGVSCRASIVNVSEAVINDSGTNGVFAEAGGNLDVSKSEVKRSGQFSVYSSGGYINARQTTAQMVEGVDGTDFRAVNGGIIVANGGVGGVSGVLPNKVASGGIIFKDVVETGDEVFIATLQNGWTGTLSYSKDANGYVWVRGVLTVGTIGAALMVTQFPSGYRPKDVEYPFVAYSNSKVIAGFNISTTGNLANRTTELVAGNTVTINTIFKAS